MQLSKNNGGIFINEDKKINGIHEIFELISIKNKFNGNIANLINKPNKIK